MVELKCPSCNGHLQLDDSKSVGECVFCGSKVMLPEKPARQAPVVQYVMQPARKADAPANEGSADWLAALRKHMDNKDKQVEEAARYALKYAPSKRDEVMSALQAYVDKLGVEIETQKKQFDDLYETEKQRLDAFVPPDREALQRQYSARMKKIYSTLLGSSLCAVPLVLFSIFIGKPNSALLGFLYAALMFVVLAVVCISVFRIISVLANRKQYIEKHLQPNTAYQTYMQSGKTMPRLKSIEGMMRKEADRAFPLMQAFDLQGYDVLKALLDDAGEKLQRLVDRKL